LAGLSLNAEPRSSKWNAQLAADYLESRQKEWSVFPAAKAAGGPCMSCHTGLTYLMARTALDRTQPGSREYRDLLLNGLKERIAKPVVKPTPGIGTESVLAAVALGSETALERMWSLQIREGETKGAWPWFNLKLDPWETTDSTYFGASLAAMAAAKAPADYRKRPDVTERLSDLKTYLLREQSVQPLHNQLALLWASMSWPDLLSKSAKKVIIEAALNQQQSDGGWTTDGLGEWKKPVHPRPSGSDSYATAWTAFVLVKAGVKPSNANLARALNWLEGHQDSGTGAWPSTSMNKQFEAGSMPERFMQDAATGFAVVALLDSSR